MEIKNKILLNPNSVAKYMFSKDDPDTIIASNANIASLNGITINNKCKNKIISTLNSSLYLPAISNEENVPSTYIELFGN